MTLFISNDPRQSEWPILVENGRLFSSFYTFTLTQNISRVKRQPEDEKKKEKGNKMYDENSSRGHSPRGRFHGVR